MTKSTITRERIQRIIRAIDSESYDEEEIREWLTSDEIMELARMALAAMGSEPHTDDELSNLLWYSQEATCHSDPNYYCEFQRLATPGLIAGIIRELQERRKAAMDSEPVEPPLDYLHGHKDGLEWAAQLAEANHPDTGDWLYDDPIELAKAIRKGPDMPPAQPAADSEPVAEVVSIYGDPEAFGEREIRPLVGIQQMPYGTKLYLHAQPAPVVPDGYVMVPKEPTKEMLDEFDSIIDYGAEDSQDAWRRLLAAAPQSPGSEPATVPGKWIPVSERMPEDRTEVILWDAEIGEVTSGHYSHKTQTFYHCGDAIENEITHWMLPPSAPQGVKP